MMIDILLPILTISGIAVGLGIFLCEIIKGDDEKYDERQLIERGRGANIAMLTAFSYLLGLYVGLTFELIRSENMGIYSMYGLTVMVMVYDGYCIFHDAFLKRNQNLGKEVLNYAGIGVLLLALALYRGTRDLEGAWFSGAISLCYLPKGVMLCLRALMLRVQERRAEKNNDDG